MGFLNQTWVIIFLVIGLLSGGLSVVREVQSMYWPSKLPKRRTFWIFVRIAFVGAAVLLLINEHQKVEELSKPKNTQAIQVNIPPISVPPAQVFEHFLPAPTVPKEQTSKPTSADLERGIDKLTLHDLFATDFKLYNQARGSVSITDNPPRMEVEYSILKSAVDRSKFIAYYIPTSSITNQIAAYLSKQAQFFFDKAPQFEVNMKGTGDSAEMGTKDLPFTGVFVYHETFMPPEQTVALTRQYADQGQAVIFRSIDYLSNKKLELKVRRLRGK